MFKEEMKQYPLFLLNIKYGDVKENFYFHYGIDYATIGVFGRVPAILYTGVAVNPTESSKAGNTISLDSILEAETKGR